MNQGPDYRGYLFAKLKEEHPEGRGEQDGILDADVFGRWYAEEHVFEDASTAIREQILKPLVAPEGN